MTRYCLTYQIDKAKEREFERGKTYILPNATESVMQQIRPEDLVEIQNGILCVNGVRQAAIKTMGLVLG